jgi:hypothetical protein
MRKRAKGLLPSRLTEDNIVEMSICDRGNALEKDVGKRQVLCPVDCSSYDLLDVYGQRTKKAMKSEDTTRINLFGEHIRTRCGRRAQDQALRW